MNQKMRLSPQQQQENVSRNQICEYLELHSFVTGDISPDLGEDILVRIYDNGVSTGLSFYLQLKSTDNIEKYTLDTGDISYPFEVKDLEHWDAQAVTVFLVVWDVKRKQGWWIWINEAIKFLQENNPDWKHNKTANIHIFSKNILNEGGLLEIRHLLADLYYSIVAKDKELHINAKFTFPQTEEGKAKFEGLKRYFAAGDEIEIDGKYIEKFDYPDWWKRLYGEFETSGMHIKMGPQRSLKSYPVQLEFSSIYGNENIPYVELWAVKQGTEEITFTNDQQKIPVQISFVLNKVKKQQSITITPNFKGADFPTIFHLLKIQKILSAEGNIKIIFLETGENLNIPVPSLSFPPLDQDILDFIENICIIQNSMGIIIQPREDGIFTLNDKQAADELVSIIEKNNYKQNGLIFTIDMKKAGIGEVLKKKKEGPLMDFLLTSDESYVEILSQKIELGPFTQRVRGLWNMPEEEVQNWFNHAKEDDSLMLKLEEVELFEEFENWKNNKEKNIY